MKKVIFISFLSVCQLIKVVACAQGKPPSWVGISIGSTKEGASPTLLLEYSQIISQYDTNSQWWWEKFKTNISETERQRLEQIYRQMDVIQQSKQKVAFVKAQPMLKKCMPTSKQFALWKQANIYGVWINGKHVDNAVLDQYKKDEIAQVTISKLYGAAKAGKSYAYQVDLMTTTFYQVYYDKAMADGANRMVFR